MSHQLNWIYYNQRNINFLVFVAGKYNKIFLFVSFKCQLDTFVIHGQVATIKK